MSESLMQATTEAALWLVPAAPLAAAVLIALLGPIRLKEKSHWPCIGAIGLSLAASLWLLLSGAATEGAIVSGHQWIDVGGLDVAIELRADAMTALMLATVTFVSLLVAVYS
ncbi:MAG: NADH-quinone oxidoreductase subunit L, partial [Planctomycetaceae bacterium]